MNRNNRIVPDVMVIGAMKSGTTTLYRHLAAHPQIGMSRDKETDFFVAEKNYDLGPDWYTAQFDPAYDFHGEASPNYTKQRDFPGVPERIHRHCPETKFIYVVRDPLERAISQYRHAWVVGSLHTPPEELYGTHHYHHLMDASHYARQLDTYLAVFPYKAFLILDFDDLCASPQAVMDRVYRHLGLPSHPVTKMAAQNDSRELSRVPAPLLRFGQTRMGRAASRHFPREARDRIRQWLARGPSRRPAAFPDDLVARMREELAEDAARFRRLTGLSFSQWSV